LCSFGQSAKGTYQAPTISWFGLGSPFDNRFQLSFSEVTRNGIDPLDQAINKSFQGWWLTMQIEISLVLNV
jgi:hypothetical protein